MSVAQTPKQNAEDVVAQLIVLMNYCRMADLDFEECLKTAKEASDYDKVARAYVLVAGLRAEEQERERY